jgi:hypothetical protein
MAFSNRARSRRGPPRGFLRKRANYLLDFGDFLAQQAGLDLRGISAWVGPFLAQPLPLHMGDDGGGAEEGEDVVTHDRRRSCSALGRS